ncbi:MAG: ribonuclease P protein component [Patescibacteria group bacterium]|nr:ribonuclease P protein component [Patescibacteria group bacterium]MDD4136186.1 ribonuclease P protein component [Candidatus Shapirobacteria bacterium]
MLNQSLRLNKNKEFDQVFQAGHSFFGIFLGIKALKNEKNTNKFGVLVGLKISKLAVKRNLVKRRIKSVLEKENKNLKQGYNIVVITKPEIINQNYQDIKEEILRGLNKLKLYV